MAKREVEADAERAFAVLHQFARDIIDRGDVICIQCMAQSKGIRERRGADQDCKMMEAEESDCPDEKIDQAQSGENQAQPWFGGALDDANASHEFPCPVVMR